MGSKQEESEVCLQVQDLTGITETWWDGSCDWCAAVEEYGLLGRTGLKERRGSCPLCKKAAGMQGALPGDG